MLCLKQLRVEGVVFILMCGIIHSSVVSCLVSSLFGSLRPSLSTHSRVSLSRSSPVAQQVKDLAQSLKWLGLPLWLGFSPWPGNFHMPHCPPTHPKEYHYLKLECCLLQTRGRIVSERSFLSEPRGSAEHFFSDFRVPLDLCCLKQMVFYCPPALSYLMNRFPFPLWYG